ncbi:hypothetical protein CerSpe_063170 [Prunus speciosa]
MIINETCEFSAARFLDFINEDGKRKAHLWFDYAPSRTSSLFPVSYHSSPLVSAISKIDETIGAGMLAPLCGVCLLEKFVRL